MRSVVFGSTILVLLAITAFAQPAPALKPIRYERTGGINGTHDLIEISRDGNVVVDGKTFGQGRGRLSADRRGQLVSLFGDWASLPSSFPAPPGYGSDGYQVRISYGPYEVSANDANGAIPPNFVNARKAIEQIARSVTGR